MSKGERWEPSTEQLWNTTVGKHAGYLHNIHRAARRDVETFDSARVAEARAHYEPIVAELRERVETLQQKLSESIAREEQLEAQLQARAPQLASSAMSQAGDCDVVCSVCGEITEEPHTAAECFAIAQVADQYVEDSKSDMISELEAEVEKLKAQLSRGAPGVRETVARFAWAMEEKLRERDHARGDRGWLDSAPAWLISRMADELKELLEATDNCRVASEAVDVANFAMMLCDVVGELPEPPPQLSRGVFVPHGAEWCIQRISSAGVIGFESADKSESVALSLPDGPGLVHIVFIPGVPNV